MAYFKPRRNIQGFTEKKKLPRAPEGASIGGASLYDAFVESIWRSTLDEYRRKEVGFGDRQSGKEPMDYPDKEVWWDDPRSRLDLSREYHKYYSEEDLEKERIFNEELDSIMKLFFESLPKSGSTKIRKKRVRKDEGDRIGGGGIV